MDSTYHFLSSILVGAVVAIGVGEPLPTSLGLVVYAGVLGVGIDLDHFLLARYRTGSWRALRACLSEPTIVLFDRSSIFESGEVGEWSRLLTHLLIGSALVAILSIYSQALAILSGFVLLVHVILDLMHDSREESTTNA